MDRSGVESKTWEFEILKVVGLIWLRGAGMLVALLKARRQQKAALTGSSDHDGDDEGLGDEER